MDKITLTGIEFFAYHGVLESEKQLGQMFTIDCELVLDTSFCNDEIEKTVNYGDVALKIKSFACSNQYDLLESLANNLVSYLMYEYPLVEEISLTVHKPHAPIATKFSDVSLCVTRKREICYLAIGSNLGDRKAYLDTVKAAVVQDKNCQFMAVSTYTETLPYGVTDQPSFFNAVIKIKTFYTPNQLLKFCQSLEQAAGRVRLRHWGERTLDIDILMYGDKIIYTEDLIVPHPEMDIRDFVLAPLCEIDPHLIHPIRKMSVKRLLEALS